MRPLTVLLVCLAVWYACDKTQPPAPARPAPARAPRPDAPRSERALFEFKFNDPAIPAAPNHSSAHPGPDGAKANRAGFTQWYTERSVAIRWAGGGGRLYADSVIVDYRMRITIEVSSDYKEGTCPYRVTWEHELSHARAFRTIFAESQVHLTGALEHLQGTDDRLPTRDSPLELSDAEAQAYRRTAGERVKQIVEEQDQVMSALLEDHRRDRDSPEAYKADTDKCPQSDWFAGRG